MMRTLLVVCLLFAGTPFALAQGSSPADLERAMQAVQSDYERGVIDDEQLLAAFRPFYSVHGVGQSQRLDEWVRQYPESYVARLARGIHYKYVGLEARGTNYRAQTSDAQMDAMDEAYDRAEDDFNAAMELDDKPLLAIAHVMDIHRQNGRAWQLDRLLAKGNEIDPGNVIVRRKFLLSLLPRWSGSLERMHEFIEKCRGEHLADAKLRKLESVLIGEEASQAFYTQHDPVKASALLEKALALDPENVDAEETRIRLFARRPDCEAVITASSALLEHVPDDALALSNRGYCLMKKELGEAAVADYEHAADVGDPWAQMELSRAYWNGKYIPQDRKIALDWLRISANRGNQDARETLTRLTGETLEPLHRKVPLWKYALLIIGIGGFSVGRKIWIDRSRLRARPPEEANHLVHPVSTLATGVLTVAFFGGLLIVSHMYRNHTVTWWTDACFAGFMLMGVIPIVDFVMTRHELVPEGLRYRSITGRRGVLKWSDVKFVNYASLMWWFKLHTESGAVVRVSAMMMGMPEFARAVLARVPASAIEDRTHEMLQYIAEGSQPHLFT